MKYCFLPIMIIMLCLASCGSKVPCEDPALIVVFDEFDSSLLTDVVLYKYVANTSFTQLTDSVRPGKNIWWGVRVHNEYDWEIKIAAANRTYRIRDIQYDQEKARRPLIADRFECYNKCSFYVNDSFYTSQQAGNDTSRMVSMTHLRLKK